MGLKVRSITTLHAAQQQPTFDTLYTSSIILLFCCSNAALRVLPVRPSVCLFVLQGLAQRKAQKKNKISAKLSVFAVEEITCLFYYLGWRSVLGNRLSIGKRTAVFYVVLVWHLCFFFKKEQCADWLNMKPIKASAFFISATTIKTTYKMLKCDNYLNFLMHQICMKVIVIDPTTSHMLRCNINICRMMYISKRLMFHWCIIKFKKIWWLLCH